MKLSKISYTSPSLNNNNNDARRTNKNNPSFGNLAVGLASFIENNGFLGEFLTIDTVGMMAPRTVQGYTRNREELGHLNYKAGREELVRELLSGPAYFYVPLSVLTMVGLLRGKSAKVQTKVLDNFKGLMKNTAVDLKNAAETKKNFVSSVIKDAFKGYDKETQLIEQIKELMNRNVTEKLSFKDKILNIFAKKADKKVTPAMIREQAVELVTKLNKANGKLIDNAGAVELTVSKVDKAGNVVNSREAMGVSDLFKDMANYLDDFTAKAAKAKEGITGESFVEKFHKKAKDLRNATNILAVSALSAFLMIIPKLYQTDKTFPGKAGLDTGEQTPPSPEVKDGKEAV